MSLIFRLIVGRVEIVDATLQAGLHDGEVLIRESHVDTNVGMMTVEEGHYFLYVVGIHLIGSDIWCADTGGQRVAFFLAA